MSRDMFNKVVNDIDNYNVDINEIIDKMQSQFKKSASCCIKRSGKRFNDQPIWFDKECKEEKKEKYKLLRKYRACKNDVKLELLKNLRSLFKSTCDNKIFFILINSKKIWRQILKPQNRF